jgi:hypothetical protein
MDVANKPDYSGTANFLGLGPARESGARELDVSIYENQIPDFVAQELERLYEAVYCTVARFDIYGEAWDASTYVARAHGAVVCVILFRLERDVVKVINQQIAISEPDLREFAGAIFSRYRSVRLISCYAIETNIKRFPFPFQKFAVLEENVVALPRTPAEYTASLSQNLSKRLQSAKRKLKRDHADFSFEVLSGNQVSEQTLRELAGLARARMAAKQQAAYLGDADIAKILRVIHIYGFVGVLRVNGKMRGGNIFYGVGKRYFMHVIAHDPDYDKYMLGHLVQYLAACYCIERGGRECCLMGGGRETKARFGAFPKYLESVDIYRSRLHYLLALRRVAAAATRRFLHRSKQDFLRFAQDDSGAARAAAIILALLRSTRQRWRGGAGEMK